MNFYDIASGTGSGTISFLYKLKKIQNLQNKAKINIFLQDISPTALEIAKILSQNLSKDLPYNIKISTYTRDSAKIYFDTNPDLVVLSFSIYDIFGNDIEEIKIWCRKVLKSLDKNGLFVMVEPASKKTTSRIIMEIRNEFRGHVLSPCTHLKDCPLLKKGDWCHFGTQWTPPLYLSRAMNMVGLRTPNINFSFVILSKEEIDKKDEKYARVVSHRLEEKGKITFWTCEKGSKIKYYTLNKNISEANKKIESVKMGDIILIQNAHQRKNNEYEIAQDSTVEIKRRLIDEGPQ